MQTTNTLTVIDKLDNLPPLSRQSQQLLAVLNDPDLDTGMLVNLLKLSPALSARLLGIARSAFFSGSSPPRDLADAVIRFLGLELVRDLAIAFTLSAPLRTDRCTAFKPSRYWRHALLTASLAEQLTAEIDIPYGAQAYLAGLLHNLGLLALVHVAPLQMQAVFLLTASSIEDRLSDVERVNLGVDHCQAGLHLARAWRLPEEIADVMSFHRDRQYLGRHWELVSLTTLAEGYCSEITSTDGKATEQLDGLLYKLAIEPFTWARVIESWKPTLQRISELADQLR